MTGRQEISRPDKVLFPDPGLAKADLAAYVEKVPDHAPVDTVSVPSGNRRGHVEHLVVDDVGGRATRAADAMD